MSVILLLIAFYMAWAYSKTEVDPDWAFFNLAAFTGSWYGRDFADCKTPAIHLWYYGVAKLVGVDVKKVKFAHHFLMGAMGILVMYLTNSFWNGLAFTVLINSAWLYAFHGNVGQVPAVLLAVAIMSPNPYLSVIVIGLACFFEPKLMLAAAAMVLLKGVEATVFAGICGAVLGLFVFTQRNKDWVKWTWESSFTVPRLVGKQRVECKLYQWVPWFTAESMLYVLPWIFAAVMARPDWMYWLPAALYMIMIGYTKVIRQNHLIPLVAWITCAGISPFFLIALLSWDFISAGFYIGDIWKRHYGALWRDNIIAREIGTWLRDKPGTLWVNDYQTAIYIYARKKCPWHIIEQAELNTSLKDRRQKMIETFNKTPADYVVVGSRCGAHFGTANYRVAAEHKEGGYKVYQHE